MITNISESMCAHLKKSPRREHITPVLKNKIHWLKIQDRIVYTIMYYNMAPNTFLERLFIFDVLYEWNKLSEHIKTSNFDWFRKGVKTMLFTQQYGC